MTYISLIKIGKMNIIGVAYTIDMESFIPFLFAWLKDSHE